MNINNPTTFSPPDLTLGTSNSSGTAGSLRADDTILVFDTTDPASVATAAGVGSATTAPRRDHVHPGMTSTGTVVDNAVARFDGTTGALIQGYTSASPTISDAGIFTLTAGQLVFPATQTASTGANTLDDYEEGDWTPSLGGNCTYTNVKGRYTKIGRQVFLAGVLIVDTIGTGSTSVITGNPLTAGELTAVNFAGTCGYFANLATNTYYLSCSIAGGASNVEMLGQTALDGTAQPAFECWGSGTRIDFACSYNV